jgi:hypothetical protein
MKKTLENSLKRPGISWTKKGGNPVHGIIEPAVS